jgi:hypothetical protein
MPSSILSTRKWLNFLSVLIFFLVRPNLGIPDRPLTYIYGPDPPDRGTRGMGHGLAANMQSPGKNGSTIPFFSWTT